MRKMFRVDGYSVLLMRVRWWWKRDKMQTRRKEAPRKRADRMGKRGGRPDLFPSHVNLRQLS